MQLQLIREHIENPEVGTIETMTTKTTAGFFFFFSLKDRLMHLDS